MMSANLRAFLFLIRWCEGTSDDLGYRRLVGGSMFNSFEDHPRTVQTIRFGEREIHSSAAGAYQFLEKTWDRCASVCDLQDFSPEAQDKAAVWLIEQRRALPAVEAGDLDTAISLCAYEWASLPGSPYGQPTKTLDQCRRIFEQAGGTLSQAPVAETGNAPVGPSPPAGPQPRTEPAPLPKDFTMPIPALVTAAASALLPIVADLFRARGSKTATRNAEIVDQVADVAPALIGIAKTVAGGGNEQQAVEAILGSKDLQQQFRAQVALQWSDIEPFLRFEEESRDKARAFTDTLTAGDGWRSVAAGMLVGVLSLFIIVGGGVLFWDMMYNPNLDPGQKGLILGALIAVFGQAAAFWFGSSRSSQVKDQTIAEQAKR